MKIILNILQKLITIFLIIFTFPIQLLIFFLLLIELKEFPLYFQKRGLTLEKKLFTIMKFKTILYQDSLKIKHKKTEDIFYIGDKVNIKPISKILRITGLDELPQLYNILIGDMNFIGPRPLMIEELKILKNDYPMFYNVRNTIKNKPGLTGLWQVIGDRKKGVEELIGLEMFYEANRSFKLDIKILYYTIILMFTGNNSDAIISRLEFISKYSSLKIKRLVFKNTLIDKSEISYQINLPENWWTSSDTFSKQIQKNKNDLKIINISKKN